MRTVALLCLCWFLVGCSQSTTNKLPVFKLATSEYPSWSTFMVAGKTGLINKDAGGEHGSLEKKYGIDIELIVVDYDQCVQLFGSKACDAVCITNMDVLPVAKKRPSTVLAPTSTSDGADKLIVNGISNLDELKDHEIHLLAQSVSEYMVYSCLEKAGKKYSDYKIKSLDPAAAATALQSNATDVKAICVWNPFALNVIKKNPKVSVLASSADIPGEIDDLLVAGSDSLDRDGGDQFAKCVCETFYTINKMLAAPDTADKTLKMLGEDFSDLPVDDMRIVVKETKFFSTPASGIEVFNSKDFKLAMEKVESICQKIGVLDDKLPSIGFDNKSADLNFTTKYMQALSK